MKLRSAVTAGLAGLVLALAVPGSAFAATGDFGYSFTDDEGRALSVTLHHPSSDACVNLPYVGSEWVEPGHSPHNDTDQWATVYEGADCTGPTWKLRPHGKPATERLKVRSVYFQSPA
ncbi:peptidase inhibitor family I36 protein [Streptomyces polygonati]|uniref:Peptidase inhibitor family I36 protein n=1 Tax=Streptomyces polygonati TaxID=1617087 RepID=A0ABV8HG97_9ACTN